jgi:iron complex outermembrane recepter protein
MKHTRFALAMATALPFLAHGQSTGTAEAPITELRTITIMGPRPTSLPTQIPTVIEGTTAEQIQLTTNAFDAGDALKYLPSLNVRKRYVGDFNHAVLASRASGTGNSARSLVFADGIPLSNLLGNGAAFTPRWGLVSPEEIERVDVLYGPFSAAYSGNSVGAVVDYQTRMPEKLEAHAKLGLFTQHANPLGSDGQYGGNQASASLGSKVGDWSYFLNFNRTHSKGQPLTFTTKNVPATSSATGTPVTGALPGQNPQNVDWLILAATTQYDTTQEHIKAKLAYDFSSTLRASYTLGWWGNTTASNAQTYLRDAAGNPVYSGPINVNGRAYTLAPTDISVNQTDNAHVIHGLSLKTHTKGEWDWEIAASLYDYAKDTVRAPTLALPAALNGGAGRITDQGGTGWNTLALKGIWRPSKAHKVDFGYQREAYQLRTLVTDTANWINGSPGARFSAFNGNTSLQSLYAQDHWKFAPGWNASLGARLEQWRAFGGELGNATNVQAFAPRSESHTSPKAAVAYQVAPDWSLKASTGRAVRMPTAAELYQGAISGNTIINTNPNLKPEKSQTTEFTAERDLGNGSLRTTLFHEQTKDALYSQPVIGSSPLVSTVQNVDRIRTLGLEVAYAANDVGRKGLDLSSSLTYANSIIQANAANPASVGKHQPRVPNWRANFLASYRADDKWSSAFGLRYSGTQYSQLDNSDTNSLTYIGVSKYLVADVRMRYQIAKQWTASFGIDNLNNAKYWAFHPYPQRSYVAELKFDL